MHERSRKSLRRDTLAALVSQYAAQHADPDGKLRARFETLYLTGWAPDDSQQKPLAPGSAKARLADALGTTETIIADPKTTERKKVETWVPTLVTPARIMIEEEWRSEHIR